MGPPADAATDAGAAAPVAHRRLPNMPGLDGIRGVAVVLVLVHHLRPDLLSGGFLGVDVFFALSGYLITSLLLGELGGTHGVRLSGFWSRRARRLLPALYLTLIGVAAATHLLPSWQWGEVRADGIAALLYVSNWWFIVDGQQYFDTAGAPSPLLHLWSLAIEEQAYIFWPLMVLGAWRWGDRRWGRGRARAGTEVVGVLAAVLAVASAVSMAMLGEGIEAYFGTHTRVQAIMVGAVAAVLVPATRAGSQRAGAAWTALGVAGTAVVLVMSVTVDGTDEWMYRGGFTLVAVAATAAVVGVTRTGPVAAGYSLAPLRALGKVSYGLYLIHWPVIVFCTEGRTGLHGWALTSVQLGITAVLTMASYVIVEQPVRTGRLTTAGARRLLPVAIGVTTVAVLASGIGATPPPDYLVTEGPTGGAAVTTVAPLPPTTAPPATAPTSAGEPGQPPATTTTTPALPRRITLVGDSVLDSLEPGLSAAATDLGIEIVDRSGPGCGVVTNSIPTLADGTPVEWAQACLDAIPDVQRTAVGDGSDAIVVLSTWEAGHRLVDGRHVQPMTPEWEATVGEGLAQAADRLGAGGATVVLVGTAPMVPGLLRTADDETRDGNLALTALQADVAAEHGLGYVDMGPIVCDGRPDDCPVEVDGVRIRPDDGRHFSPDGAAVVGPPTLDAVIAALAAAAG